MSLLDAIRHRARALLASAAMERERDDEIAHHLTLSALDAPAGTTDPQATALDARRAFGNPTVYREEMRHMGALRWLDALRQDARFGMRTLVRAPGFFVVAVMSLALAIGGNTAIFGVIHALLLERLPIERPRELVQLHRTDARGNATDGFTLDQMSPVIEAASRAGVATAAFTGAGTRPVRVGDVEPTQLGEIHGVDGRFFALLGLRARAGRLLAPSDDAAALPVAVIAEDLSEAVFGSADAAVGKTVELNHAVFTIVGVTPRKYRGLGVQGSFGIAIPMRTAMQRVMLPERVRRGIQVSLIGRVRTPERGAVARSAIDLAYQRCCIAPTADQAQSQHIALVDISHGIPSPKFDPRARFGRILFVLMGGVAVLLLIACANVGTLLLARATARARELAVRLSLGASRARLVRQLLVESAQLATAATVLGILIAIWGTRLVAQMVPAPDAMVIALHPNAIVLGFTLLVAIASLMIFGVLPAIRATRVDPVVGVRERSGVASRSRGNLDRIVVGVQVALALLLVTSASLLVRTLDNLRTVDAGYDTQHLLIDNLDTRGTPYAQSGLQSVYREIARRVGEVPGVRAVGFASAGIMVHIDGYRDAVSIPGYEPGPSEDMQVIFSAATGGYFAATGIALRSGRDFDATDVATSPRVAIVSEGMARTYFGGRNPIGAVIRRGDAPGTGTALQIVGVAADARYFNLRAPAPPVVYIPYPQWDYWGYQILYARGDAEPDRLAAAVRSAVEAAAPGLSQRLIGIDQAVADHLSRERIAATLGTLFGAVALVLAAVGLFGLLAYQVAARSGEIGIRMALGADARRVVWLVLRQSLGILVGGIVVGVPLAFGSGRAIASQLYGVTPGHPANLVAAAAMLLLVGVIATVIPARRAARVDPLIAMRAE